MQPRDQIQTRMYVVLTLVSLLPVLIGLRMVRIHLGEGRALRQSGHKQASGREEIPALRGTILDAAGRVLATNQTRSTLALDPTVKGFSAKADVFFEKLSDLTGVSSGTYRERVRRRASPQYVVLHRGLTETQVEAIESWGVPGLRTEQAHTRRYPYGRLAAHVLGHTGRDGHGLAGIEMQYDAHLQGKAGYRAVRLDARRNKKAFVGGALVEPHHGETVVLTLDLVRQSMMEEELAQGLEEAGARWATAIAMDPRTGAILAMANAPTYDPHAPGAATDFEARNHAITDQIEPGSTFKLVTAAAAVEEGLVTMDETIDTGNGALSVGGYTYRDTHGYGPITFAQVIEKSSNVGAARVAQRMERETLYRYARALGFGQNTWIDLPGETDGRLKRPSQWSGTTRTSMAIGYEVAVTPLQMLAAYCALANGGLLVQPYVVSERRDLSGRTLWRAQQDSIRRAFSSKTARALRPAFVAVVDSGTARRAQIEGLTIAGKTGTARKAGEGGYAGRYRSSFVGFFPADDPQVAMIVVVDEPTRGNYGGTIAAPIFQRIAERWVGTFPKIAARLAPVEPLPTDAVRPVPDVVGAPLAVAERLLRAAGFEPGRYDPREAGVPVAGADPDPGVLRDLGGRVRLVAAEAATAAETMPDLTGLSVREARLWLSTLGVRARVEGVGLVARQSPPAGATLEAEATLTCR